MLTQYSKMGVPGNRWRGVGDMLMAMANEWAAEGRQHGPLSCSLLFFSPDLT